jgi:hypothetical protein
LGRQSTPFNQGTTRPDTRRSKIWEAASSTHVMRTSDRAVQRQSAPLRLNPTLTRGKSSTFVGRLTMTRRVDRVHAPRLHTNSDWERETWSGSPALAASFSGREIPRL